MFEKTDWPDGEILARELTFFLSAECFKKI